MKPILCVGSRDRFTQHTMAQGKYFEIVSPNEVRLDRRYLLIQTFDQIRGYTEIEEIVFLEDSESLNEIDEIRKFVEVLRPKRIRNKK